ncbi:MAG: DUF2723 domain-containing protein [Cryomorphaceae bacterium]|nr:MAG: DUF2723 domain-containing protein [Cryomorphaceae bacterium]|tara:strand:+ start:100 stop:3639 length:3540 start_codon:yes stop_codon:yes gene_type:complete
MNLIQFEKWNTIVATIAFLIALGTFSLTVEPTASYWDCAEYISTSAKLQIGHPPGAPLFQMLGAFFSSFAFEVEQIAFMVNMMSVFASAFTILFLFLTITIIGKKIILKTSTITKSNAFIILGSSLIGSLCFTFSDSFWFNAVEAEVYAMATMIMALLFWLGFKWEENMNNKKGDKWLVLISFVVGLSFGVHFMGLLAIPAIGMIYFFKKNPSPTLKSFIIANIISVAILLFIFKLLLPSTLGLFGYLEVFFVNNLGLPFNSGTIFSAILILSFFYFGLKKTQEKKLVKINTFLLCIMFVFIGFSSWLMIPIRSNANTVINENAPSDARALLAYYNLEQYPDTHIFYGPMYSDAYAGQDPDKPYKDDKPKYEKDLKTKKYIVVNDWKSGKINSNTNHVGLLPRMWSSEHASNYMKYFGYLSFKIKPEYRNEDNLTQLVSQFKSSFDQGDIDSDGYHEFLSQYGGYLDIKKPSLISNIKYLFQYQMGSMYWRYFMWNFVGKQNDIQWKYDLLNGNWISGINFIDEFRLGPQKNLSDDVLNNKGRNKYYFLPLIFGIIGLLFLFKEDKNLFWIVTLLFLFTGLALKVYVNERIFEPRERDYALVGSFYVFCIFIGLSALSFYQKLKKIISEKASPLIIIILLTIPFLMAFQNWDDHDRSHRYTAQSLAKAYLNSIDEGSDPMIFTIGDNDTFALWYAQEIENYRTDVRTINTSLIATDWYIDQMKKRTYNSSPIPSQLEHRQYAYGVRDYIKHEALIDSVRWDIKDFMDWVGSDHPRTKYKNLLEQYGAELDKVPKFTQNMIFYPTNKIRVPVNKKNVIKSGLVSEKDYELILDYIDIDLPSSGLYKNQLLMLDILANNDWKRPIYFTGGSYNDAEYLWMKEYLQLDGLVYKLVPIRTKIPKNNPYELGKIDSELMYKIVKGWEWGNSNDPNIYHDPETRKNSISFRGNLHRLSLKLLEEGEIKKSEEILDLSLDKMPVDYFGFYSLLEPYISTYYKLEKFKKGDQLFISLSNKYQQNLKYYSNLSKSKDSRFSIYTYAENIITDTERYRSLVEAALNSNNTNFIGQVIEDYIKSTDYVKEFYGEYEYYTLLIPFIESIYKYGSMELSKDLYINISNELRNRLILFHEMESENQSEYIENIANNLFQYTKILNILKENESDDSFIKSEIETFLFIKEKLTN